MAGKDHLDFLHTIKSPFLSVVSVAVLSFFGLLLPGPLDYNAAPPSSNKEKTIAEILYPNDSLKGRLQKKRKVECCVSPWTGMSGGHWEVTVDALVNFIYKISSRSDVVMI